MYIDILYVLCSHIVSDGWPTLAEFTLAFVNILLFATLFCCSQRLFFQQLPCMPGW